MLWEICLKVDASDVSIRAALEQRARGAWRPLGVCSKKLSAAERNYGTYDRELLAAHNGIKLFNHILEAPNFIHIIY